MVPNQIPGVGTRAMPEVVYKVEIPGDKTEVWTAGMMEDMKVDTMAVNWEDCMEEMSEVLTVVKMADMMVGMMADMMVGMMVGMMSECKVV
jgi:hypothetical protein